MNQYVYILECADGSWYTGYTNDLYRRLEAHKSGYGAKYTRSHAPVKMIYARAFASKTEAMQEEYRIKQMPRAHKERFLMQEGMSGKRCGEDLALGHIFYLMGKSAVGKDHVYDKLLKDEAYRAKLDLKPLVIYTTRPMRTGEQEGVEYHFTDAARLEELRKQGCVVEERAYDTVQGIWYYFTVDDASIDLTCQDYLGIGTLESFVKLRRYYGRDAVIPLYIETADVNRLEWALKREKKQAHPDFEEMCRRFLADQKDFSENKLQRAGVAQRFPNNGTLQECIDEIAAFIRECRQ